MATTVGGFLKQVFEKGKAHASVHMRKSVVDKAQKDLERIAYARYSSLYLGSVIQTTMMDIVQQLDHYVRFQMYGWQQVAGGVATDGKSARYHYALDFTETFILGQWGCPLEPITMPAKIKVNIMTNNNQTEPATVGYRLMFAVNLRQGSAGMTVDSSIQELIDPTNANPYIRSGNFEAPSMLHTRGGGVTPQGLLEYLHSNCRENRPGFQQWFDDEGRHFSEISAAVGKLQEAQRALEEAQANLNHFK